MAKVIISARIIASRSLRHIGRIRVGILIYTAVVRGGISSVSRVVSVLISVVTYRRTCVIRCVLLAGGIQKSTVVKPISPEGDPSVH